MKQKVQVDPNAGFCFGVQKAIEAADHELQNDSSLYSLGKIVHNSEEINRLGEAGLRVISSDRLEYVGKQKVLIRAHGEAPATYELAKKNNVHLIDATCSVVVGLQKKIKKYAARGYQILIYGKSSHPEVIGLVGHSGNKALVIESEEDFKNINPKIKTCLFAQTTKNPEDFKKLSDSLRAFMSNKKLLVVKDSICRVVTERFDSIKDFAESFDCVLFIAGESSSNGKMLFEMCTSVNPNTFFFSSADEVHPVDFAQYRSVGVTGATSTPPWLLKQVADKFSGI